MEQEYREQRAQELMGVLCSLWEALEVEQEDVDRGIFTRLMSGPARLHGKSIQKVPLLLLLHPTQTSAANCHAEDGRRVYDHCKCIQKAALLLLMYPAQDSAANCH